MDSFILLGTCLELLGANQAIDTYAVPIICDGDPQCGTTSVLGGPTEYAEGQCYLTLEAMVDSRFDWIWCQPVAVVGDNGPVHVSTPCVEDATAAGDAPYGIRVYWAGRACPEWLRELDFCDVVNVCTAQDKLNGDCTCTAAEQAANECTP